MEISCLKLHVFNNLVDCWRTPGTFYSGDHQQKLKLIIKNVYLTCNEKLSEQIDYKKICQINWI
jgi:hypothetical protein